jgi:type VI protein secretion system component VasK
MSSGSKMVLFFLAATVFNLVVMAVLIVVFVIAARLVPVQAVSMAILFIGLIASMVLTFMIYAWVMKKVTVRFQLEKHIPQLFKGKKKA